MKASRLEALLHTAPSRWSWPWFPHQTRFTLVRSLAAPATFGEKCVLCQCYCACEVREKSTPVVAACNNGGPNPAFFHDHFHLSCPERTTSAQISVPLPGWRGPCPVLVSLTEGNGWGKAGSWFIFVTGSGDLFSCSIISLLDRVQWDWGNGWLGAALAQAQLWVRHSHGQHSLCPQAQPCTYSHTQSRAKPVQEKWLMISLNKIANARLNFLHEWHCELVLVAVPQSSSFPLAHHRADNRTNGACATNICPLHFPTCAFTNRGAQARAACVSPACPCTPPHSQRSNRADVCSLSKWVMFF